MLRSNHVSRQSCFTLSKDIKPGNHINHSPHGYLPGTLPDQRTIMNPWIISTSSRWISHFTGCPPGLQTNNNYCTGHVLPVSIAFSNSENVSFTLRSDFNPGLSWNTQGFLCIIQGLDPRTCGLLDRFQDGSFIRGHFDGNQYDPWNRLDFCSFCTALRC
jgi:hypothetical protein